ncbi:MAG: glycosyltransferase [Bacteroidia bacterium]
MHLFELAVISIYGVSLVLIVLYSLGQLHLIVTFLRRRHDRPTIPPLEGMEGLPFVTIQLPIYNELYVVERLLDAVGAMDYPKDRFEIQLLDDSTDETVAVAARKVAALQAMGVQIEHIRRPHRTGYKAGALAYGLEQARGEYIAIFDADFLPHADFLRAMLANFTHPRVGVVQARWEHLNRDYSIFTEVQAFHLDAHFTVEQFSRAANGYYLNFNGTAGIWRKTCIEDAGGWHADTLTEDLDLSYRAQLRGWEFRYVDEIGTPAELPAEMGAIKSQQYRWMKGGAEVARKMLLNVWRSPAPILLKLHATMHLLSSSVFILVLLLGASSIPLLYLKHEVYHSNMNFLLVPVIALICSSVILACLYIVTFSRREQTLGQALRRFLLNYIPFLSFSMGLSLHNTIAVLQGFWGKKTPFVRTPKFNVTGQSGKIQTSKYISRSIQPGVLGELFMALYFGLGVVLTFRFHDFSLLPFLMMELIGFGVVGLWSFRHALDNG